MPNRPVRCYRIADPQAFKALIGDAVAVYGGVSQAAGGWKSSHRSQLSRLRSGHIARLNQATLDRLSRLVEVLPDGQRRLRDAILAPASTARTARQRRWVQRATSQLATGQAGPGALGYSLEACARADELERLCKVIRVEYGPRAYYQDFDRAAARALNAGVSIERIRLAEQRAFEPLVCHWDTDGVERSWEELSDKERCAFVQAALRREAILLRRPGDLRRAQWPGPRPPVLDKYGRSQRPDEILAEGRAFLREHKPKGRPTRSGPKKR